MIHTKKIKVKLKSQGFHNITREVEDAVRESGIEDGVCLIFSIGATSGLIINEDEPMLLEDLRNSLNEVANENKIYHHVENAYSHIRSILVGNSKVIPIKNKKLVLGTWQEIMVANFDTRSREREVFIMIFGE